MASSATKTADQDSIKVGSKVRITGTHYATGQKIPDWVKAKAYTVSSISSSKALLDKNGICSWVKLNDLKLDGANTTSGQTTTAKTETKKEEKKEETKSESMNKTGYVSGTGGSGLNVRSGAGTSHSRIGGLSEGASVSIIASKNGWYQIKYGSGTGWVSSSYIKIGEKSGGGKTTTSGKGDAKLAKVSRNVAAEMQTTGWCAKGVNTAIRRHYGYNAYGNGNQVDNYLISNGNFKQLNYSLSQALSIPGVIMTWEKTGTAAGQKYGHTAISQGNGADSTCDFYEYNTHTKSSKRTGFKCFLHNDYV